MTDTQTAETFIATTRRLSTMLADWNTGADRSPKIGPEALEPVRFPWTDDRYCR